MFEEYALAAPALADNGRYVAFVNLRIDVIEDRSVSKTLSNVPKFDQWGFHVPITLYNERGRHIPPTPMGNDQDPSPFSIQVHTEISIRRFSWGLSLSFQFRDLIVK